MLEAVREERALAPASLLEDNSAAPILLVRSVSQATNLQVSKTLDKEIPFPSFLVISRTSPLENDISPEVCPWKS